MEQATEDAIVSIIAADLAACCRHVQAVEKTNIAMEEEIEKLVFEVTSNDEDTDTASACTDYSETDTAEEY